MLTICRYQTLLTHPKNNMLDQENNQLPPEIAIRIKAWQELLWANFAFFLSGALLAPFALSAICPSLGFADLADFQSKLGPIAKGQFPELLQSVRGMALVNHFFTFLFPALLFVGFVKKEEAAEFLKADTLPGLSWLMLGLLAMLVSYPLIEWIYVLNAKLLNEDIALTGVQDAIMRMNSPADLVLNFLLVAVMAGVGEELLFRGIIQQLVMKLSRKPWIAIGITAFAFGFLHFHPQAFVPITLMGVLLGYLYWRTGNIWVNIIAHTLFNGVQVVLKYFAEDAAKSEGDALPWWSALLSAILLALVIWYMERKARLEGQPFNE